MVRILQAMLFLLVHILLYHKTTANQEIRFKAPLVLYKDHETHINKTVLLNEELNIVFVNVTGITDFKCNANAPPFGSMGNPYMKVAPTSTIFTISNITNNMSTKWRCKALVQPNETYDHDASIDYLFEVKVKSARKVNVTVNSMELVFKNATVPESEYDGIYEYYSEEDAFLDLKCSNAYADGLVQLIYFDANGHLKMTSDEEGPFRFQQIMRPENHKSYVDCTYLSPLSGYRQEFKYRTFFLITNEISRKTDTTVRINNMKIAATNASRGPTDLYHYSFSHGEIVTITCEKEQYLPGYEGAIAVTFSNMNGMFIADNASVTAVTSEIIVDPKGYDQVRVHCLSKQGTRLAEVLLNRDPDQDPVIRGFPANDLLYQFNTNNVTWEAHYLYSENKEITLQCVSTPNKTLTWNVGSTTQNNTNKDEIKTYLKGNFTFNSEHKDMKLVCNASKPKNKTRTVTVVLHQKPTNENLRINNIDYVTFQMAAACLVAVLLITVFTVCVYYRFRNKTQSVSEKPFKNFSANTNPMPTLPIQSEANEYTYITNENFIFNNNQTDVMKNNSIYFDNKQVYAVPDVKTNVNKNALAENLYSEIKENIIQENAKEIYSKPYDHCKQMDTMKKSYTVSDDNDLFNNEARNTDKTNQFYTNTNNINLTSEDDAQVTCDPEDNNDKKYSNLLRDDSYSTISN